MRSLRVLALVAVLAGVGVACDDEASGLTKEDWIKAADAICVEGNDAFNALIEESFPTSAEATQAFVGDVVPIFQQQVEGIAELEPPEDDAEQIADIVSRGEAGVDDLREAAGSPEAAAEIFNNEGGENITAFEDGLVEYGAEDCSSEDEGEEEGEEEEDLPDPSTFSAEKRAFVEDADAICQETAESFRSAEEQYLSDFPPPLENWASFLGVVVPAFRQEIEDLRDLDLPAEDAELLNALFDDVSAALDQAEEAQAAAEAGDQEEFDRLFGSVSEGFDDADRRAREYGFQVCGSEDEEGDEGGGEEEPVGEEE